MRTNHTSTTVSTSEHNSGSRDAGDVATRSPVFGIWFGVVLLIAALLRTYKLGSKSFWLDEAASNMLARSDWHTFLNALVHHQANMTLYYLLLRGWTHLGNSEAFVRLLSVLFGVASIPLMYRLAAYIFGQKTARVAALLLSVHQFHIQYSQEARGYSLLVFLALLSCYLFVQLLSTDRKIWLAYVLTNVLVIYAHVFGAWVTIAQWIFVIISPASRPPRNRMLRAAGVIVLLALPLAASLLLFSTRSQLSWINQNSASGLYRLLQDFTGNGGNYLMMVELAPILGSLYFHFRRTRPARDIPTYMFVWIWLLVPVITVAIASFRWPLLQSRYLIVCLPPFLMLVADGLVHVRSRVVFATALMAVVASSLVGVSSYFEQRKDLAHSDDWRDATRYILSEAQSGDAVLFPYSAEEIPFRDYEDRFAKAGPDLTLLPRLTDLELLSTPGSWTRPDVAANAGHEFARVWVISALQPTEASRHVQDELSRSFREASERSFGFITTKLLVRSNSAHGP
jgi:mannosyltransferase